MVYQPIYLDSSISANQRCSSFLSKITTHNRQHRELNPRLKIISHTCMVKT